MFQAVPIEQVDLHITGDRSDRHDHAAVAAGNDARSRTCARYRDVLEKPTGGVDMHQRAGSVARPELKDGPVFQKGEAGEVFKQSCLDQGLEPVPLRCHHDLMAIVAAYDSGEVAVDCVVILQLPPDDAQREHALRCRPRMRLEGSAEPCGHLCGGRLGQGGLRQDGSVAAAIGIRRTPRVGLIRVGIP